MVLISFGKISVSCFKAVYVILMFISTLGIYFIPYRHILLVVSLQKCLVSMLLIT